MSHNARFAGLAALAALAVLAGCVNVERSRNLGNPDVPALTLAQQVCSNCHGLSGNSISPNFPNLAGQQHDYTVAQLTAFKSHSRQDPAGFEYMWGLSRSLTEAQIDGLAAYYAAQTPQREPAEGDPARVPAGKVIFETGVPQASVPACATCHGSEGQGAGANPRIAGQHADYIVKQLDIFQRTEARPAGAAMKVVAHGLTQENIQNVAAYLQQMTNP